MIDRPRVDLFCEDSGHEQYARALIQRIAAELDQKTSIRTRNGRGGHGKAITEFKAWQRAVTRGYIDHELPDLLVLLIDANCIGWAQAHRELEQAVEPGIFPRCAIGCPDPHVERWYLADPQAVQEVLGIPPLSDPGKCERDLYKQLLRQTIENAGQPIASNQMEYAPDLVSAMNFFRAGKNQPSLRHFVEEIRSALQQLG